MMSLLKFFKTTLSVLFITASASICSYAQQHDDISDLRAKLAHTDDNDVKTDLLVRLSTLYLTKPGELKSDLDSATLLNNRALKISREYAFKNQEANSLLLTGKILLEGRG